ncbi:hybrid signal transduction histidine kinase L-like [Lucilia sericata]|uniref:hybrid signal transduction histidine kinase L-like n=1 Tax=Lucilia sericata TaxID=13632 RepID=UPI0018A820AD|nr:hybrid signal transduction histidine kinase L-like [Lucilia sericata]
MSLATSVAGSTIRPQQQQHVKGQQKCTKALQSNNNSNSIHSIATPTQSAVNCLQQSSPQPSSTKTSLETSPIAANLIGSSSLFSFESGVVLSGSSGCCSLSNSPSSSSSSNSYLTSHSLENSCNKLTGNPGNQMCLNTSINLEDSFTSGTCQLNASLLAAVNGDLEDDQVIVKSLPDTPNQTESNLLTPESLHNNNNNNSSTANEQRLLLENMHHQHAQQSTADSSCLNNEDARTLQLAVELTMMNLNKMSSPTSEGQPTLSPTSNHYQQLQSHHLQHSSLEHHQPYSSSSSYTSVGNPYHMTTKVFLQTQSQAAATLLNQHFLTESNQDNIPSKINSMSSPNQNLATVTPTTTEERSKKSQNMTECVPVPSSEHVAEIVGRQGKKYI